MMDLHDDWSGVKALFRESFTSSFHYAVASVGEDGEPFVTPIGSLILGKPGTGFYFEKYTHHLPLNLTRNRRICVLAVNSARWFWMKSLARGRFIRAPAIRLHGIAGDLRPATEQEIARWRKRVRFARFTKGYALIWRDMSMVRDVEFTRVEPVHIGGMTQGLRLE